jgi:radical SAM superfamily enzyme YgiQ (UPF0313 family)
MRILFVNVINESRKKEVEVRQPSFGTLYLASYLSKYGGFNNVQVLECGSVSEQTLRHIKPDVVGVSAITQHFNIAKQICSEVKKIMDIPVVLGGYHISALPNNLTADMDIGVIGEGEETMLEVANMLETIGLNKTHLSKTNGIVYWNNGKLEVTPRRDLIRPLDKIPFPSRHLVSFEPNNNHSMFTSRGCPYYCVFCSSSAFWGSVRYHSASYVVEELHQLMRGYHPKVVGFNDDLFATNKERLREIAKLIKTEEFYGQVKFTCSARANLVDAETARLLKEIGVFSVGMGLESGSERVLKYLKSGSVSVEQNKQAIDLLSAYSLKPTATLIIGSPTETVEEIRETLNFAKHGKLASFETYVLLPLPNTFVWDEAKAKGIVSDDMNWDRFEMYFEDIPESRVIVSELDRIELLEMLRLFKREAKNRLAKRIIVQGILHPLKALEFARKKFRVWNNLRSLGISRKVRTYLKHPDRAIKKFCWMLLGKVPPLASENYDWHWNYLSFKGKTVLDLGADYGSTADYFLKHGATNIIIVEGNRDYVTKFNRFLGHEPRIKPLWFWIEKAQDIDFLIRQYAPDIVKVDIEGDEQLLLDANVGKVPEWLVETHTLKLHREVGKFFMSCGFKVSTVEYGKTLGSPEIKVVVCQNKG